MRLMLSHFLLSCSVTAAVSTEYAGYDNLERLIVFGDSYTTTDFSTSGDPPSLQNPLGNIGKVNASGPGWVQWLTTKYNGSDFVTYNMAVTASSIDNSITPSPSNSDVITQITEYTRSYLTSVISKYVHSHKLNSMITDPDTTLVAIWLGINDVTNVVLSGDPSDLAKYDEQYDESLKTYYSKLEYLHGKGVTNFLIINVPPVHRTPWVINKAKSRPALAGDTQALVETLNDKIWNMTQIAKENFPNTTTIYHYDAYKLYNTILDDTSRFPETAHFKDVETSCEAYAKGTRKTDYKSPDCTYAVDRYFWLNKLHPTSDVHRVMAGQISELLSRPPP